MGETGSKHAISTMYGDGILTSIAKCLFRKSLPKIIGLVIGKAKHCCGENKLSITKTSIIALFVITLLPVGSVASNHSTFFTSLRRHQAT